MSNALVKDEKIYVKKLLPVMTDEVQDTMKSIDRGVHGFTEGIPWLMRCLDEVARMLQCWRQTTIRMPERPDLGCGLCLQLERKAQPAPAQRARPPLGATEPRPARRRPHARARLFR